MEPESTLTVKINGIIETPPVENREEFRQSVIETILHVLKTQDVDIEYIGYRPDFNGIHQFGTETTQYEDCVYASLSVNEGFLSRIDTAHRKEDVIDAFIEAFENKTHRHMEIDTVEPENLANRVIKLSSNWKQSLQKQG